jgi:hypothetical protein
MRLNTKAAFPASQLPGLLLELGVGCGVGAGVGRFVGLGVGRGVGFGVGRLVGLGVGVGAGPLPLKNMSTIASSSPRAPFRR